MNIHCIFLARLFHRRYNSLFGQGLWDTLGLASKEDGVAWMILILIRRYWRCRWPENSFKFRFDPKELRMRQLAVGVTGPRMWWLRMLVRMGRCRLKRCNRIYQKKYISFQSGVTARRGWKEIKKWDEACFFQFGFKRSFLAGLTYHID